MLLSCAPSTAIAATASRRTRPIFFICITPPFALLGTRAPPSRKGVIHLTRPRNPHTGLVATKTTMTIGNLSAERGERKKGWLPVARTHSGEIEDPPAARQRRARRPHSPAVLRSARKRVRRGRGDPPRLRAAGTREPERAGRGRPLPERRGLRDRHSRGAVRPPEPEPGVSGPAGRVPDREARPPGGERAVPEGQPRHRYSRRYAQRPPERLHLPAHERRAVPGNGQGLRAGADLGPGLRPSDLRYPGMPTSLNGCATAHEIPNIGVEVGGGGAAGRSGSPWRRGAS